MPFVPSGEYDRLTARSEILEGYESMGAIILLAQTLKDELVAHMTQFPDATAEEVGDLAYQRVFEIEENRAKDAIVAEYEQAHRLELYGRVIDEVKETEGPTIYEDVKRRLESDPELAVELRDSARKELGARALSYVTDIITDEQREIINHEAERQIELDRLDVELAVDGELDLIRDDVVELLEPNDRLVLFFKGDRGNQGEMVLLWREDVNGNLGWVLDKTNQRIYDKNGNPDRMPKNKFIIPGSLQNDLVEASLVSVPNVLKAGLPLAFMTQDKTGEIKTLVTKVAKSGYEMTYPELIRSDLQTRTLFFDK
jgi:hypothetical protein